MFKTLFVAGALLAAASTVAKVGFGPEGVRVGGRTVTEAALQLREADGGHVLASKDVVESLGGVVEITLDGGRLVSIEPGVRIARTTDGYELSTHGRRPMLVSTLSGFVQVASPAAFSAVDGGWMIGKNRLDGDALCAALVKPVDALRVAEGEKPADPKDVKPAPTKEEVKGKLTAEQLAHVKKRLVAWHLTWEAIDVQTLLHLLDVSPVGDAK